MDVGVNLTRSDAQALLADFGQARFANDAFVSLKGTITYMAPEQLTFWTRRGGPQPLQRAAYKLHRLTL